MYVCILNKTTSSIYVISFYNCINMNLESVTKDLLLFYYPCWSLLVSAILVLSLAGNLKYIF